MTCCFDPVQLELILFKNNVKLSVVVSVSVDNVKHQTFVPITTNVLNKFSMPVVHLLLSPLQLLVQHQINVIFLVVTQLLLVLPPKENVPTQPEIAPI